MLDTVLQAAVSFVVLRELLGLVNVSLPEKYGWLIWGVLTIVGWWIISTYFGAYWSWIAIFAVGAYCNKCKCCN